MTGRRQGGTKFLDHWQYRSATLPGSDELTWTVNDRPGGEPFADCFRTASRGPLHHAEGRRLLASIGHADAAVPVRRTWMSEPLSVRVM